ncbi:MAG TPA: hypothetical protein VFC63_05700 [Blastocatellia bacterium]|nr:hypothetical protein [Blastocatellia bacterium]
MKPVDRRGFLLSLGGSLFAASALRPARGAFLSRGVMPSSANRALATEGACWLDVSIPFVIEDPAKNYHTDILLSSDCFPGREGFEGGGSENKYEILLYDAEGRTVLPSKTKSNIVTVPAMRPTVLKVRDLVDNRPFLGGMKLRMQPSGLDHYADLFSAAYIRWNFNGKFATVHANPDPQQFKEGKWYYSMPVFPSEEYNCTLSLFNPYENASVGTIKLVDGNAQVLHEQAYKLDAHSSGLVNMQTALIGYKASEVFGSTTSSKSLLSRANVILENDSHTPKTFAYMMVSNRSGDLFSTEHPLYQGDYPVASNSDEPFEASGKMTPKGVLFTPLIFSSRKVRGLELNTRVYLSIGRPLKENLWMLPFVSDAKGEVAWTSTNDQRFSNIAGAFRDRDTIRLKTFQSISLDTREMTIAKDFSGGFGVAVSPESTHTLMKVEVRAENWNTAAFTHFRPGGALSKGYLKAKDRGETQTDYVIGGARVERSATADLDCLLAIMNIGMEDGKTGTPSLEVFGSKGLLTTLKLGEFPALACRHVLLSDLIPNLNLSDNIMMLRLIDMNARMIMSAVHIDFRNRTIALDHGSDRFST